jgi:predicted ribosome quality control (RQC) complex YloA/Tae2 family protein
VVLRLPSKETEPPPAILEQAAQLAAANSRSKHSETVPVVYTRVKYVHRIRKASPGTVRLTNETVIFVKPFRIS